MASTKARLLEHDLHFHADVTGFYAFLLGTKSCRVAGKESDFPGAPCTCQVFLDFPRSFPATPQKLLSMSILRATPRSAPDLPSNLTSVRRGSHARKGKRPFKEKPSTKAIFPFSRGKNRVSQGVENRGSPIISAPLALGVKTSGKEPPGIARAFACDRGHCTHRAQSFKKELPSCFDSGLDFWCPRGGEALSFRLFLQTLGSKGPCDPCVTSPGNPNPGLIQLVLTVLVLWSRVLAVPWAPSFFIASSRRLRLCPWTSICFKAALSGPLRLRVQSRSRTRLRIAASIAFLFRACFEGVLDTIAQLSRGWAPHSL